MLFIGFFLFLVFLFFGLHNMGCFDGIIRWWEKKKWEKELNKKVERELALKQAKRDTTRDERMMKRREKDEKAVNDLLAEFLTPVLPDVPTHLPTAQTLSIEERLRRLKEN